MNVGRQDYPSLEHEAYVPALLKTLHEKGGWAPRWEARPRVGELLNNRFGWKDWEKRADGQYNWEYRIDWMRTRMVMDGLMEGNTSRGMWKLTEEGERQAARLP